MAKNGISMGDRLKEKKRIARVMLAAPASGSGKTLVTCGILQAFVNRGLKTAAFKCGPDYIDPMFHEKVIKTVSKNLDTFLVSQEMVRYLFAREGKTAEISVLEGVMGYYDGIGGISTTAASYELAKVTETPVILIVNTRGMSLSVVPLIEGFLNYKQDSGIAGVILNQMPEHLYSRMKEVIENRLPVAVLGYVPRVPELVIESRHLGLVTPDGIHDLRDKLNALAAVLEKTLELDKIIALARNAEPLSWQVPAVTPVGKLSVGVTRDEAFCFLYRDNISLLQKMGAEIKFFSPLHDQELPRDVCGLIFYGGYPELYAKALSENHSMLRSIQKAARQGIPYLAECGGFMYLHTLMEDLNHTVYKMADIIKGKAFYTGSLNRFGYITLTARKDQVLCGLREQINAHEFHYYDSTENGSCFLAQKPNSSRHWDCIRASGSHAAGFPHLHYYGNMRFAFNFLKRCLEWGVEKND